MIWSIFGVSLQAPACARRRELSGTELAIAALGGSAMSLVRLLGFRTLTCGCVIGSYREVATSREVTYVEEKGPTCELARPPP